MLLEITLQCSEECSHCLVSATKDSTRHMSERTFTDTLNYLKRLGPTSIQITGGEPTQHPNWFEFVNRIAATGNILTILSNGQWISDDEKCKEVKKILNRPNIIGMQVTSYKRYCPGFEKIEKALPLFKKVHEKVIAVAEESTRTLVSMGRAKENSSFIAPVGRKYPSCSNFLLSALQSKNWIDLHRVLVSNRKLCIPTIDPEGQIHIGESWECCAVGTVNESFETMFNRSQNIVPCGRCGLQNPFLEETYWLIKEVKKGNVCVSYSPGSSSCSFVPAPRQDPA